MEDNLLKAAKKLKAQLEKRVGKLSENLESTSDMDRRDNVAYAVVHIQEVIEALECNE